MAEGRMPSGHNRLLMTLPPEDYRQMSSQLERVSLGLRDMLYEPLQPIEFVYFPIDGVMSMLADMEEDSLVEVATVGNEGMVGLPLFLGASVTPGQAFSQVPGEALRMTADAFIDATVKCASLPRLLHRYTQALMIQISQGTACNRVHEIEQRCARWLLLTHDRVGADEFSLTQEFLGQMLGVRRATVNNIAVQFQEAGYIEYSRGRVRIRNRRKLEAVSCRCYSVIREEYDRMLGGLTPSNGRKAPRERR
ncbi:MAG TPA: Crp/Fnr family transcriptional regulator [Bryobacteraceae bacterium]|nr:Crp/Fnr family transcriptional regulator [Bryobacteraceae bacterium]